jgi:hypothetical protein
MSGPETFVRRSYFGHCDHLLSSVFQGTKHLMLTPVLLLTATIDTGSTPRVVRSNPRTRLQDYEQALLRWLRSRSIDKVVFCENSGYDLSDLKAIAAQFNDCQVEFLSFDGNAVGALRGKGFAELNIILHALSHSSLLSHAQTVIKCTGRLGVRNPPSLISKVRAERFDVMCDIGRYLTYADSRFFAATPDFILNYLGREKDTVNDSNGIYLEHALACATTRAIADRKTWRPLPTNPQLVGISGTLGSRITDGPGKRQIRTMYSWIRRLVYRYRW